MSKPIKSTLLVFVFLLTFLPLILHSQPTGNEKISRNKAPLIVGYQIAGHTYLGVDYEFKLTNLLGIHAGVGINGYTAGVKLHMNNCIECPHLNISFKDGGFGAIGTVGAEFAARLLTFKKNGRMAIFAQFGYGYLVYLSDEKRERLFSNKNTPPGILTFSLGLSF